MLTIAGGILVAVGVLALIARCLEWLPLQVWVGILSAVGLLGLFALLLVGFLLGG